MTDMEPVPGSGKLSRREFAKRLGLTGFGVFAFKFLEPELYARQLNDVAAKLLTQDRFAPAVICPTKLYYSGKSAYTNTNLDDPFMEALGEGGFQVSALAKFYHPDGKDVASENALETTARTLNSTTRTTLFGAAVQHKNMIVEPDILILEGDTLTFVEVKAKAFNGRSEDSFRTKKGKIRSSWRAHLYDIAFQKHVISKAFPRLKVNAQIMMADTSKTCPTEGLNQKFRIVKGANGSKSILVSEMLGDADRKVEILTKVNVDSHCHQIYSEKINVRGKELGFEEMIKHFSEHVSEDKKIIPKPAAHCRDCEFKGSSNGLKSGFEECWSESLGWKAKDFAEPTILKIWDFRRKPTLIKQKRIKQKDVKKSDIRPKSDNKPGISRTERQWLQVQKVKTNDTTPYIDRDNLKREMDSWVYPLHFIDFETSAPAIPFTKGMRPYEGIAFQYSHHIVYEDGRVEHKGEWLNAKPGDFPNFDFVRALKKELEGDRGSIFRYSSHENTYLNFIYRQLGSKFHNEKDADQLRAFIKTITRSTGRSREKWMGARNMIDQWRLVKRYYYDPQTRGSNSIKQVLPAIMNSSKFLQEKYSQPIYGTEGLPSLNFRNWRWIKRENGQIIDPYKRLPKMFQDASAKDVELLSNDNTLGDGGAALTAYGRLQFEEMSDYERTELERALLKYCELDTFAMVMIHEGWRDLVNR